MILAFMFEQAFERVLARQFGSIWNAIISCSVPPCVRWEKRNRPTKIHYSECMDGMIITIFRNLILN